MDNERLDDLADAIQMMQQSANQVAADVQTALRENEAAIENAINILRIIGQPLQLPNDLPNYGLQQGLTAERIQQFYHFEADESLVDHQCAICRIEIEVGRRMMRLDCDGQHTFCQECIKAWFANHNTCPLCRHSFQ